MIALAKGKMIGMSYYKTQMKLKYGVSARKEYADFSNELEKCFNLLVIVSANLFEFSDHSNSLKYARILTNNYPSEWEGYGIAARSLTELKDIKAAQKEILAGLQQCPNEKSLLVIERNIYHSIGEHEKSLECSKKITFHHPDDAYGFELMAKDLIHLKKYSQARQIIQAGLQKFTNRFSLLFLANTACNLSHDYEKGQKYAELLIAHYPCEWEGYAFAAKNLIELKKFSEAEDLIILALQKFPNHLKLIIAINYLYFSSGDYEKGQKYAELLIAHYPCEWEGYDYVAKNLIELKKFSEANEQIILALQKFPNHPNLLMTASNACSSSGDHENSYKFAEILVYHYSDLKHGYEIALKEAITLQKFEEAILIAKKGILNFEENEYFISILSDVAFSKCNNKINERCENILQKALLPQDVLEKLNVAGKSLRSQLRTEYSSPIDEPKSACKIKPDLYIVAGFSGCGKTTFLNSVFYSVDSIFHGGNRRIKILPIEVLKFLEKRRSLVDSNLQAMLFCNAFEYFDFIDKQKVLPMQTLFQLDITYLLLSGDKKFVGFNSLELQDLAVASNVDKYLQRFCALPIFQKFNSISIATIHQDFNTVAERYTERTGKSFYFDSSMKGIYDQVMQSWQQQIHSLSTGINCVITESDGYYEIAHKNN